VQPSKIDDNMAKAKTKGEHDYFFNVNGTGLRASGGAD
jgi:hypothetical protein